MTGDTGTDGDRSEGEGRDGDGSSEEFVRVFELRGVYLCTYQGDRSLPTRVASRYNEREDRYELPTRELVAELGTVVDVELVADPTDFQVRFRNGDIPAAIETRALFVENRRTADVALFPTPDDVQAAIDAGGRPVE